MISLKEKKIPTLARSRTHSQNRTSQPLRQLGGLSGRLREKSCIIKSCKHYISHYSTELPNCRTTELPKEYSKYK